MHTLSEKEEKEVMRAKLNAAAEKRMSAAAIFFDADIKVLVIFYSRFYNRHMKPFTVIYEDEEIILVHKEAGVCVQGGKGITHSLDEDLSKQTGYKVHLVHRLDRDTDGILIVAKNAAAASKWTNLIAGKSIKKEYYAWTSFLPLVNGKPSEKGRLFSSIEQHGRTVEAELFFEKAGEKTLAVQSEAGTEEIKVYLTR